MSLFIEGSQWMLTLFSIVWKFFEDVLFVIVIVIVFVLVR